MRVILHGAVVALQLDSLRPGVPVRLLGEAPTAL
jgi:hypothetical protein